MTVWGAPGRPGQAAGSRRWHPASVAEDAYLLGIDVGGTKCVIVLADARHDVIAECRLEDWASGSAETDLDTLVAESQTLLENADVAPERVAVVGISAPGPLDAQAGVILDAPNIPGWRDVHITERLDHALGIRARLENDANAAALAEWRFGAGRGTRNMIFLTMSTGVGGGLILDGRLYSGSSDQAGEVGHMPVVPGGRPCNCGLRGCLEAYTSGAGIAGKIREDLERSGGREGSAIVSLAGGDPARISARLWVEALREGDPYSAALREEFLEMLAQGLAMLVLSLDPERIVLGTIVRQNPDLFLDEIRTRTLARVWPSLQQVEIVIGELGSRLPAYAALAVAALGPPESGS